MPIPKTVRDAFDLDGPPITLAGGSELSLLVDNTVIKQVLDPDVGVWLQWLNSLLCDRDNLDFRVPRPLPTLSGQWIQDGWIASEYIPDLTTLAHRPAEVARVGRQFSAAATATTTEPGATMDNLSAVVARSDRWARGFRAAMGQQSLAATAEASIIAHRLFGHVDQGSEAPAPTQTRPTALETMHSNLVPNLIHCDLTGNVFIDGSGRPVVLDISPDVAEVEMGTAIIVADHLLWRDGDLELIELLGKRHDLLARGLLFRLFSEQLALSLGQHPRHGAVLDDYDRVLSLLDW